MTIEKYLKEAADNIDNCINEFDKREMSLLIKVSPKLEKLYAEFSKANGGGKRLRGMLVMLGYEMIKGEATSDILQPALAYEIFQTAILGHDDIIDKSPIRRGQDSIYFALQKKYGEHYGISQTICLGDIGLFNSSILILNSNFDSTAKFNAISSFIDTQLKTGIGELLDVELPYQKETATIEDILTVYEYKTSHYTIIGPLHLGAILAGANTEVLKSLESFGKNLGIAFQLKDDVLGIFGNEEKIGKSVSADIEEGKITCLWYYAIKNSNEEQTKLLQKSYGKGIISSSEIENIRQIFIDTGALEKTNKLIYSYVLEAKQKISEISISETYKDLLIQLADYMVGRDK